MKKLILILIIAFSFGSVMAGTKKSDQIHTDTTGINIHEIQKLKLYPNPASNYIHIEYDVIYIKEAKLQIYNSIGAIVYTKNIEDKRDNLKISVADYKNGLYFCSLQIDGKLLNTRKILINH